MDRRRFEENISAASAVLRAKSVDGSAISHFAWRCIGDGYFDGFESERRKDSERFLEIWEASEDEKGFIEAVLGCRELAHTQGYGELFSSAYSHSSSSALPAWWWDEFAPEAKASVWSESGCVFLCHDGFCAGYGYGDDGQFEVVVLPKETAISFSSMFEFAGSVEGRFNVAGSSEPLELDGRFGLYAHRNLLVLVRWS